MTFKSQLYENLISGMITKEEYTSFKAKYTRAEERIRGSIKQLKAQLDDVMENRSERLRWINRFTEFANLTELDRKVIIQLILSIRVVGKKEIDIRFNYEDEYKRAMEMLVLPEERRVG